MSETPPPPAPGAAPKKNADLPTRFAAGVMMIAVALAAVYLSGWVFRVLGTIAGAVMLLEWAAMHGVPRFRRLAAAAIMAFALIGAMQYFPFPAAENNVFQITYDLAEPMLSVFLAIAGVAIIVGLLTLRPAMTWGFVYIGVPSAALIFVNWAWWQLSLWALVVVWATDIFAYAAGRGIGGPKLAPRLSPNKTWAGLFGGVAGAAVCGALAAYLLQLDGGIFYFLGGPFGLLAQIGDLYESGVKRRRGVKDSGTLIPGHGGVLDRLDGLLPVALATFLVLLVLSRGTA
jgi:phosphatidate cytidylyltransferase